MRKEFNITGSCNPQWHYMVNTEERFQAVVLLIDEVDKSSDNDTFIGFIAHRGTGPL